MSGANGIPQKAQMLPSQQPQSFQNRVQQAQGQFNGSFPGMQQQGNLFGRLQNAAQATPAFGQSIGRSGMGQMPDLRALFAQSRMMQQPNYGNRQLSPELMQQMQSRMQPQTPVKSPTDLAYERFYSGYTG